MTEIKPATVNPLGDARLTHKIEQFSGSDTHVSAGSEFDRFQKLAGKLVKIPKTEVDDQRKKT